MTKRTEEGKVTLADVRVVDVHVRNIIEMTSQLAGDPSLLVGQDKTLSIKFWPQEVGGEGLAWAEFRIAAGMWVYKATQITKTKRRSNNGWFDNGKV